MTFFFTEAIYYIHVPSSERGRGREVVKIYSAAVSPFVSREICSILKLWHSEIGPINHHPATLHYVKRHSYTVLFHQGAWPIFFLTLEKFYGCYCRGILFFRPLDLRGRNHRLYSKYRCDKGSACLLLTFRNWHSLSRNWAFDHNATSKLSCWFIAAGILYSRLR